MPHGEAAPEVTASVPQKPPSATALTLRALAFAHEREQAPGLRFEAMASVRQTSTGRYVIPLQETFCGVPVLHAIRSVRLDPAGEPTSLTGTLTEVGGLDSVFPQVTPALAARAAFLELATRGALPDDLSFTSGAPVPICELSLPSRPTVLLKEPLEEAIIASMAVYSGKGRPRLVWEVRVGVPRGGGSFLVRVSADKEREDGPVIQDVIRLSSHAVRGTVFEFDPRMAAVSRDFPLPLEEYPDFSAPRTPSPDWVLGGETRGNNVDVRTSDDRRIRARDEQGELIFEAPDDDEIAGAAINAFYLCNFLHDFFYLLGFDERVGNFQEVNADGSPGGGDAVDVLIHDRELPGLAFFDNRTDGKKPKLELGRHGSGRHTAFDAHMVIHEFAHGVTNRVVGGPQNLHTPLEHQQSRALGEGFSDYWAISIQNYYRRRAGRVDADGLGEPDGPGDVGAALDGDGGLDAAGAAATRETTGANGAAAADTDADPLEAGEADAAAEEWDYASWLSGGAPGLRSRSYDGYHRTYRFLKRPAMNAHTAGEVWCAALLGLNRALAPGDRDLGDRLGWRLVFDSLALLHHGREGPHFLHARDAILCAFDALVEGGSLPDDDATRERVLDVFRDRGLGGNASSKNARFRRAEEGFGPIGTDYQEHCS